MWYTNLYSIYNTIPKIYRDIKSRLCYAQSVREHRSRGWRSPDYNWPPEVGKRCIIEVLVAFLCSHFACWTLLIVLGLLSYRTESDLFICLLKESWTMKSGLHLAILMLNEFMKLKATEQTDWPNDMHTCSCSVTEHWTLNTLII